MDIYVLTEEINNTCFLRKYKITKYEAEDLPCR